MTATKFLAPSQSCNRETIAPSVNFKAWFVKKIRRKNLRLNDSADYRYVLLLIENQHRSQTTQDQQNHQQTALYNRQHATRRSAFVVLLFLLIDMQKSRQNIQSK